jgi:hypothetical protein
MNETTDQAPAQRKSPSDKDYALGEFLSATAIWHSRGLATDVERLDKAKAAYARACIAEAVAPALEYLDDVITRSVRPEEQFRVKHLRRLLTEGRE